MKFNVHCVGRQIIFHGTRAGERWSSEARSEDLSSPVDCHFRRMRSKSWNSAAHSCRRVRTRGTGRVRRCGAAWTVFAVKCTTCGLYDPFSHLRNSHKIAQASEYTVSFTPATLLLYIQSSLLLAIERCFNTRIAGTTRKSSWRKGECATAVRVWRPLAKKFTANQQYAISYWFEIAVVLLSVYEIFSRCNS